MKRWIWSVLIILLVLGGGAGAYTYYLYHSVQTTAEQMYVPLKKDKPVYISSDTTMKPKTAPPSVEKQDPFCVLILGVDEREHDRGRSDTIMLLAINPNQNKSVLFNIPRDTRTEIVGHHTTDKINHAYAFGDVEMSVATVEKFLDMPINYYLKINMNGFVQMIDMIGGVDVDNPFAFTMEDTSFPAGRQKLNGKQALLYTRMRYEDPRGDFGRNERQRQVLKQLMDEAIGWQNINQIPDMLRAVGTNVKTNIAWDEMKNLYAHYREALKTLETTEVKGQGTRTNHIYYYLVGDQERKRLHDLLKNMMQP